MEGNLRKFDVIVLGAGAAGLICAATAGQRGRRVALLEHNGRPGRKILVSGGGRCNFTNLNCGPGNFISENPHFAKSALALYTPQHFLEMVARHRIPWHEKTLGQLFCDSSARAIVEMLLTECAAGGVELILNANCGGTNGLRLSERVPHATGISAASSGGFTVASSRGDCWAESLVVATGGLSIPKLGATGLGYELATQFGLGVIEPRPALVPLVLGGEEAAWTKLAGVSAEVEASVGRARFREKMLVTHRGLSGPAVLQASSYWRPGAELVLDFVPQSPPRSHDRDRGRPLLEGLKQPGARRDLAAVKQALREVLPHRLADHLAETGGPKGWSNAALSECEQRLREWRMHPVGN
ncbi:MAG TPA: aminoacetone oxidase family FAD-binding enzyme, partial [Terracidiphilus sp.]